MGVVDRLKDIVGTDGGLTTYRYRCTDCDSEFDSAKDPDRAACPECLSHDVEVEDRQSR